MKWFRYVVFLQLLILLILDITDTAPVRDRHKKNKNRKHQKRQRNHKGPMRHFRMLRKLFSQINNDNIIYTKTVNTKSKQDRPQQDGPTFQCKPAEDNLPTFMCPTPNSKGKYKCIDDTNVCNNVKDCPGGEDEDKTACMFHKMTKNYFMLLLDEITSLKQQVRSKARSRGGRNSKRTS